MTLDTINPVLQWLNTHPNLAGLVTFLISASESIAIIGTIIPGSVTMTAIGTLAGAGVIPMCTTLLWAILGAIIGDNLSYWTGRYFKNRLSQLWPFSRYPHFLGGAEKFIHQHGMKSVFIGRFIGPVRALIPLAAGMLGMRPMRYTPVSILASVCWAPIYMLPGILLGKAALELPPDVAVHVILTMLLAGLFIILCLWIIYGIIKLIRNQINNVLNAVWHRLERSRFFSIVTTVLKHHNIEKTHGQLILAFYFVVICIVFINFATYVMITQSPNITINHILFYLFRSLRTPQWDNIMLLISLAGSKEVLVPVMSIAFLWLAWCKRWRFALHVIALLVLTIVSVIFFKHFSHSARPWGVVNNTETYSFPSGHTTITTVFYFGIALLLASVSHRKIHHWIYWIASIVVIVVSLSRLYLGAHWFTDIIAGLFLGATLLMAISLSYNRQREKAIPLKSLLLAILLTFSCSFGYQYVRHFDTYKANFTQAEWPITRMNEETWWSQNNYASSLYRIGRLGIPTELFNLQWVGNLGAIKTLLLKQGWEDASTPNWITVLHRIADVASTEHLPIVAPVYLDKKPVLVLIKHMNNNLNSLIVLRLWSSNVIITNAKEPLWVGSVGAVPRTYSWLINYKNSPAITLTPELLFTSMPKHYEIKQETVMVKFKRRSHAKAQPLILIKPIL